MKKRVLSLLLALCLIVGMVPVFTAAANAPNEKQQVLDRINQERAKEGAAPLGSNVNLNAMADIRAKELAKQFSHDRPDGRSCFTVLSDHGIIEYSAMGENIAAGYLTPALVMNAWMDSPGHRANILSEKYQLVGIGRYTTNSGYGTYWVQLFYAGSQLQADAKPFDDPTQFKDVPALEYYTDPVIWAVGNGVTTGTTSTAFSPQKACTRAEIVTFLWRALGNPEPPTGHEVTDEPNEEPTSDPAYEPASDPTDEPGTDEGEETSGEVTTDPADEPAGDPAGEPVTDESDEAGENSGIEKPSDEPGVEFSDVPAGLYYTDAVDWAVADGVTSGTGQNSTGKYLFSPGKACTRAEAVTFIYRAVGSPDVSADNDFTDVPSDAYYANAVTWAVENGVTTGAGYDSFIPDRTCSRGEIVTFLYRARNMLNAE